MILSFTLSMPNCNSWNGRWSGEGRLYVKVLNVGRTKKAVNHGHEILEKGYFYYNFGDGWGAGVTVKEVTTTEARNLRRKTCGFCGYDWMIDSIMTHGKILSDV